MQPCNIILEDLLRLNEHSAKVKIKFNQNNGEEEPLDVWLNNSDIVNTRWLFWRTKKKNFNIGHIVVCLVKMPHDMWLLTTVKEVTNDLNVTDGINYDGRELEEYKKYFGRVIIKYHKNMTSQCVWYHNYSDKMIVSEILPSVYNGEHFPGYDRVKLSYQSLAYILEHKKSDWIGALQNQKAVYIITDKSNGKLYIGSATGEHGMLLNRWKSYIENGHGGNKALKELIDIKGFDYVKNNFQYSILENYNASINDSVILERECYWKEILQSRNKSSGYNKN